MNKTDGDILVLICTNAFGMGVDCKKSDKIYSKMVRTVSVCWHQMVIFLYELADT